MCYHLFLTDFILYLTEMMETTILVLTYKPFHQKIHCAQIVYHEVVESIVPELGHYLHRVI